MRRSFIAINAVFWALTLPAVGWTDCSQALVQDLYRRLNSSKPLQVTHESSAVFRARLADWDDTVKAPEFAGGEGAIFLSPRHPGRALKHWFPHRQDQFQNSTNLLIAIRQELDRNPDLARYVEVVKIHERGTDWILRDFSPESFPAKTGVQQRPDVRQVWGFAIAAARRVPGSNPVIERIRDLIKNRKGWPSDNLHWDPVRKKFLIIDGV